MLAFLITFLVGGVLGALGWASLVNPSRKQVIASLTETRDDLAQAMERIYAITGHRPAAANAVTDPDNSRGLQ